MSFIEAVKTCLRKYFRLRGRARRSEFWWFYLFTLIVAFVATMIDGMIGGDGFEDTGPIEAITSLALLIPTITATVRRLHDTGRPGYYIFAPLFFILLGALAMYAGGGSGLAIGIGVIIMLAGVILQLYWLIQKSEPGMNKYGPNPIDHPHGENVSEVFE